MRWGCEGEEVTVGMGMRALCCGGRWMHRDDLVVCGLVKVVSR